MIHLQNITYGYRKGRSVLEGVNLAIRPGHIYGLFGENGVGKSTLLKCLAGLVFPQSGEIQVMGHRPAKRHPAFLEQLFFIPEDFSLPHVGIQQYADTYAPFYPMFDRALFDHLLADFEVDRNAHLSQLSFGQKKKVFIAFGLATGTRLLIMDEPTNGLDIPSKSQFRKIMATALTDDRCFIISTHQVRDLDNLIDELVVLSNKRVALTRSVEEIGRQFAFKVSQQPLDGAIYSEKSIHGIHHIVPNDGQEYTRVDIELLFKALLINESAITQFTHPNSSRHEQHLQ